MTEHSAAAVKSASAVPGAERSKTVRDSEASIPALVHSVTLTEMLSANIPSVVATANDGGNIPAASSSTSSNHALPTITVNTASEAADAAAALAPIGRKLRVLVLSSDTGGGHRASAAALCAAIEQKLPHSVKVNVVDFWVDFAGGVFKKFPEHYAFLAKHPILWKASYELTRFPPFRAITETVVDTLAHDRIRRAFVAYAPDLIVSVHPLVNTLSLSVLNNVVAATGRPRVPYVTVVTDLGGAHPTWFHPDTDMVYVPTDAVATIAARCRVPDSRIRTIGLPVRRDFWMPPPDKAALRAARGIASDCPAVLLCGGGDGVGRLGNVTRFLARRLAAELGPRAAQLVVVCGKNEALAESLRAKEWPLPVIVLGYVNDMADWMAACDMICTKAGPGTIAEALIRGLPILLTSFLPGQEEGNVRFVVDNKVGEYAIRPRRIAAIVARWLANPDSMRQMSNRAKELSAPHATEQIADHILKLAAQKRVRNAQIVENQQRIRSAQDVMVRSQVARLSLRRQPRPLLVSPAQSHLLFHLRGFLKFALGAVLARDALTFVPGTATLFHPDSAESHRTLEEALRSSGRRESRAIGPRSMSRTL